MRLANTAAIRAGLDVLTADLKAGGHLPPERGLQVLGDDLLTSDDDGAPAELDAPAQAFVLAWVPPAPPTPPDFGGDPADLEAQAADAVAALRAFIAKSPPTTAEVVANAKMQNRVLLALVRRAVP